MENEKKALVPRLRFPEFQEAEEWKETQLGETGEFTGGGTPSKSNDSFWKGSIPWVSSSDISEESIHEIKISRFITDEALESSATKLVSEGSILLVSRVGVGKLAITKSSVCTSQDFTNLTPYSDDLEFLGYLLKANSRALEALGQGMAIKGFTKEDISKLKVYLPGQNEQKKIADFLSSLDSLITAQAEKLDALKTHKKGLMQQLFPREGETVPRLRFPEFLDAGEWAVRELGSLATKVGSGITPRGGDKNYKAEGRPFIRSQNVGWGVLLLDDVAFIDEDTHKSFASTEIEDFDVLLNISGASIGRSAIADSSIVRGNVNQHVCIIRVKQEELNPVLLNQFLLSERGQSQIDSFQAGGNRQGLNFNQIRSFVIPLPPTGTEQQRIAGCLSSLDVLIAAQAEKLDALKAHKKGLMQQLFHNPEAARA